MSWNNKVVWSEGIFLRPQHFQQHVRYVESYVDSRCHALRGHGWGFGELKLDQQLLTLGKLGIGAARGIFPDGTPFNIPGDDEPPPPLDVPENVHHTVVYLALPTRRAGSAEVDSQDVEQSLARYVSREFEVRDVVTGNGSMAPLQVGKLRMRLLLETDKRNEYSCIGVTRILESRVDKNVILDEPYLPTVLDCEAAVGLSGFLRELNGLLHHRSEALAGRVSASGRGGAAEIADFLLLQAVNGYEPLIAHLTNVPGLHPETLYRHFVAMAGELATFTSPGKRTPTFPPYRHEDLQATFTPVMRELRQSLSMVLEQNAIPMPLQERKYGIRVAPITDRKLLVQANFVLAVHADVATEELRRRFPTQVKIGPVERIRELVNLALPGIMVSPLPVAPRQIPYRSGFVYFELDRVGEYWKQLGKSGGFAIHVAGDFPGLKMEFWAIKG
jgi:type VI secretion system protein ImpJ